ncbi:hypothetical protein L9F63_016629 [Diploptera punctata]|uniref:Uncharacterized protein n=1 Tax=Diploptera punctata TaxID=6984 RepID=A0AAD8A0Q8_DIPPU|nr:hypothetical protein L9F63_016629 [Diploptera punctata]
MGRSCNKTTTRQMGAGNHHVGPLHWKTNTRSAKKKMGRHVQTDVGRTLVNHSPQQEQVETTSEQSKNELKFLINYSEVHK